MKITRTRALQAPQENAQLRQFATANDPQYDPEEIQKARTRRLFLRLGFVRAVALPLLIAFLMIAAARHTPDIQPGVMAAAEVDYFPALHANQATEIQPHIEAF